ncbi:chemotaxis protein CheA [Reichenbachiella agariperforans]|uniref:chemotaxis protein CheA n=1 Tax=Reichenbachiella agariperforans TaxID=156994 RepID=UPI001C080C8B|nr:chemotaxis protein CheA [Reichenbachiella agariperforans]MBU2913584.1 chemotaxis protein CheA [Reichenbachiella agariperforans]
MDSKEQQYRDLFHQEATESFEELNKLFTDLEKDHGNQGAIDSIFRITHTIKGNAMGMGFDDIAKLSHIMEDVMGAVKSGDMTLNRELFESLFTANDKLGALIDALKSGAKVSYLGIKTKLGVIMKNVTQAPIQENNQEEKKAPDPVEHSTAIESGSTESSPSSESDKDNENAESKAQPDEQPSITFTDVIQIPVKKMDELMNLVGQLTIERDRLISISSQNGSRASEFEGLQRISSDLQYSVMNARMVQVGFLFNKFHRIVRDVAHIENKQVDLVIKGADVEIDRNILKIMSDAMIHLVRNAVSHGIEGEEKRKSKGKIAAGTVTLNGRYERDNVVIEVSDDGNGIDAAIIKKKAIEKGLVSKEIADKLSEKEIIMYIFEPGFSNAEKITEISGRGVGMDVVKKATESIGGQLSVSTEVGKGSTISLILPSSMALKGALLFEINHHEYAVPLTYTDAVISLPKDEIHKIGDGLMANYLEDTISVVFLKDFLNTKQLTDLSETGALHRSFDQLEDNTVLDVIVVSYMGKLVGLVVDKLLQQKEILEKSLARPLDRVKLLSGTTILGNGKVCLIVDVGAITELLFKTMTQNATMN